MVQHPFQYRSGHLFIIENFDPTGKLDIGVDDQRCVITFGDHLKQQLGAGLIQGHITPLVEIRSSALEIFFIKTDSVPFFWLRKGDLLTRPSGRIWFQSPFCRLQCLRQWIKRSCPYLHSHTSPDWFSIHNFSAPEISGETAAGKVTSSKRKPSKVLIQ